MMTASSRVDVQIIIIVTFVFQDFLATVVFKLVLSHWDSPTAMESVCNKASTYVFLQHPPGTDAFESLCHKRDTICFRKETIGGSIIIKVIWY